MSNTIQLVNAQVGDVIRPPLINSYSALSIAAYWRAVNFLADNLSSFKRQVRKDGVEDTTNSIGRLIKRRPNPQQIATTFWRTLYFHRIHTGNGYASIVRAGGVPVALYNLLPEHVTPFRMTEDGEDPYLGTQWYYYAPTKKIIAANDILHLPGLGYDGMMGYDPISLCSPTFVQATAIQRYQTKYLLKGTFIRGQVNIPGGVKKEKAEEIVGTIKRFFNGPEAERDLLVLSDGATASNLTLTPEQSQLIEWDQEITKKIAQITGVDPRYLFENQQAKYSDNPEQRGQDLIQFTFRPHMDAIGDELTTKLLSDDDIDNGYEICLDASDLLSADAESMASQATALTGAGIIDPNEARQELGYQPHEDPQAGKLKRSGDTSPNSGNAPSEPQTSEPIAAAQPTTAAFSAVLPLLDAACERVETKAAKAIAAKANSPDITVWSNVFAEQQMQYAIKELEPVASVIERLGGTLIDVADVGAKYAQEIRRRAKGLETKSLKELVGNTNVE